jgi:hypothetical protein
MNDVMIPASSSFILFTGAFAMSVTRRNFQQSAMASLLGYAFLETVFRGEAYSEEVKTIARAWLKDLNELGKSVQSQQISQVAWQGKVEQLFSKVDVKEFLTTIDFDKLTANIKLPTSGEKSLRATLPAVEGMPNKWVFGHQVFALGKGRSVVPHGHNNMATAFLILKGDFQGRLYDRLEDTADHMILRPTIDRAFTVGDSSTISDQKDNVHWFRAESDGSYIFNIHVYNVSPENKNRPGRVYVDPNGEKLADGKIRARKIGSDEVYKLYG